MRPGDNLAQVSSQTLGFWRAFPEKDDTRGRGLDDGHVRNLKARRSKVMAADGRGIPEA